MKSNLLKSIFCGLILTTILGSGVYAETASYERYGYRLDDEYEVMGGDVGNYLVEGTDEVMRLTATSTSTSYKLYKVEVDQKHYYLGTTLEMDADSKTLKNGGVVNAVIPRDCTDTFSDYVAKAIAYNSTSEITGVADNYTFTIYQRDSE